MKPVAVGILVVSTKPVILVLKALSILSKLNLSCLCGAGVLFLLLELNFIVLDSSL